MSYLLRSRAASIIVGVALQVLTGPAVAQSAAAFRFTDLDLRDPHVFISFVVCNDITDNPLFGTFSVNREIARRINADDDSDGRLDQSYLLEFLPLDRTKPTNLVAFGSADCSAPAGPSTTCGTLAAPAVAGDATMGPPAACLGALQGTVQPYIPPVVQPVLPCFATPAGMVTLDLAGTPLTLREVALSATFVGIPGESLASGLLRGFISETDADATIIPASVPLLGGRTLSSVLPGGTGSCAQASGKDNLDGVTGWWFYFNFVAIRVATTDPFVAGFADGFEP